MASPAGIKAGKAFVLIEAYDKTGAVLRQISKKFDGFATQMTAIGRRAVMSAVTAGLPLALSTKVFASFDDSMRKVEARTVGTREEMAALRQQAKDLGRTTSFTASQVGELMAVLGQKGFSRTQIADMTPAVMNLARGAGSGAEGDTELAAALVANMLHVFKLGASDATRVADVLTKAVNSSALSLEALANAQQYVGPFAEEFKLSVEETIAVLGQLGNVGIEASMAGTSVRGMLTSLSNASKRDAFNDMLKDLTGNTIEMVDAAGNLKKLPTLLFEIGEGLQGLGSAQKLEVLSQLFDARQLVAASVLSGGKNPFGDLLTQLQNAGGTAAETARKMDEGIGGAFRRFFSALEGASIAIGEALDPALQAIAGPLNNILEAFAKWIERNQQIVVIVGASIATIGAFGVATLTAGLALKSLAIVTRLLAGALTVLKLAYLAVTAVATVATAIFVALKAVMLAVSAPMLLLVGVGVALGAAFIYIISQVGVMADAFGNLKTMASGMVATFGQVTGAAMDALKAGDVSSAAAILWAGLKVAWQQGIRGVMGVWDSFYGSVLNGWTYLKTSIAKTVAAIWYGMRSAFLTGSELVVNIFIGAMQKILDAVKSVHGMMKDFAGDNPLFAWHRRKLLNPLEKGLDSAQATLDGARPDFSKSWDKLRDDAQGTNKALDQMQNEELRAREKKQQDADAKRKANVDAAQKELDDLISGRAARAALAEAGMELEETMGKLAGMFDPIELAAAKAANGASSALEKTAATARAATALSGLEKGTVEAAKAAIEGNKTELGKLAAEAAKSNDLLEEIANNTADSAQFQEVG